VGRGRVVRGGRGKGGRGVWGSFFFFVEGFLGRGRLEAQGRIQRRSLGERKGGGRGGSKDKEGRGGERMRTGEEKVARAGKRGGGKFEGER